MKRRILALVCAVSLVIGSGGSNSGSASAAAADVSLSKTSLTLKVKKTKTIKVKKGSKVRITKQTFSSTNTKVASVTKKGKVTAKKAGQATIKVKVAYQKNNKKKPTKTLKCKVTVTGNNTTSTPKPTQKPTQKPTSDPTPGKPSEKNKEQVDALNKIIAEQKKLGAEIPENIDDERYVWDENGNLTYITWIRVSLSGSLSVSAFPKLKELWCLDNQLTGLDISKNTDLEVLHCADNQLTNLDVSKNTALTHLYCPENKLTDLDVSKNTALKVLYCADNQLTGLDISKNTDLEVLHCAGNQLTNLDVSKNTALTHLYCPENKLTDLDVSKNTALKVLYCADNQLTNLDVSKNIVLRKLFCRNNSLTSLNLNTALESLDCSANSLTSLDISNSTELISLNCKENKLASLDISNNKALTECLHDDGIAITGKEDNMAIVAPIKFRDNMDNEEWGGDDRSQTILSFDIGDVAALSKNSTYSYKIFIPKMALSKEGSCVSVDPWFDISASEEGNGEYIGGISSRYVYDISGWGDNNVYTDVYDRQENRNLTELEYMDFCRLYESGDFYVLTIKDAPARDVIETEDGKEIAIDTTQKRNMRMRIRVIGNSEFSSIVYLDDLAIKGDGSVIWQTDFSSPESMSGCSYDYLVGEENEETEKNRVVGQPLVKLDTTQSQIPALNPALAAPVKSRDNNNENWWDDEKNQTIMAVEIVSGDDVKAFSKQYTYSYKLYIPKAALSKEGSSVKIEPWFDLGASEEYNGEYLGNISSRHEYWISNDSGSVSPVIKDSQDDYRELEESEYKDFFTMSESGDFYVLAITDALARDVINGDEAKPEVPIDTTQKGWMNMRIRVMGNSGLSSNIYLDDLAVKGDGSVIWQTDFSSMAGHYYEYKVGEDIDENRVDRPLLVNLDAVLK